MTSAADTYFWHESDGWRFSTAVMISEPFKSFTACVAAWVASTA